MPRLLGVVALLGAVFFPAIAAAAPPLPSIAVAPSTTAAELLPMLQEELGDDAITPDGPLRLTVEERNGALAIVIMRDRRKVIDRRFLLEGERVAAFRAAVLTIAEARRVEAGPPEPPPAPPPTASPIAAPVTKGAPVETAPSLWIGASFGSLWAGAAPQLGVDLYGARTLGPLRLGASVGLHGLGCCTASVDAANTPALDGTFLLFSARAEAEWSPISLASLEAGIAAGAGVELTRVDVNPTIFPGDEVRTETSGWTAIGRVGAVVRGPFLPWLGWAFRGGVEARSTSVGTTLPEGFPTSAEALAAHRFAPYLNVGLEAGLF